MFHPRRPRHENYMPKKKDRYFSKMKLRLSMFIILRIDDDKDVTFDEIFNTKIFCIIVMCTYTRLRFYDVRIVVENKDVRLTRKMRLARNIINLLSRPNSFTGTRKYYANVVRSISLGVRSNAYAAISSERTTKNVLCVRNLSDATVRDVRSRLQIWWRGPR